MGSRTVVAALAAAACAEGTAAVPPARPPGATPAAEEAAPYGTAAISGGPRATSRQLHLSLRAERAAEVCVSDQPACTAWRPYAESIPWTVPAGVGQKQVWVWFRNHRGRTGPAAVARLELVREDLPVALPPPAGPSPAPLAAVARVRVGPAPRPPAEPAAGTPAGAADPDALARAPGADTAGPEGRVDLAGGAAWSRSATVTAALAAVDPSGVVDACLSNGGPCAEWFPMVAERWWVLASGRGENVVTAWFRDRLGNVSAPVTDAIGVDTDRPTGGAATATWTGPGEVTLAWSGQSDDGSGVVAYRVAHAVGDRAPQLCSGPTIWSGPETTLVVEGLEPTRAHAWRICAVDAAGNASFGVVAAAAPEGAGAPPEPHPPHPGPPALADAEPGHGAEAPAGGDDAPDADAHAPDPHPPDPHPPDPGPSGH